MIFLQDRSGLFQLQTPTRVHSTQFGNGFCRNVPLKRHLSPSFLLSSSITIGSKQLCDTVTIASFVRQIFAAIFPFELCQTAVHLAAIFFPLYLLCSAFTQAIINRLLLTGLHCFRVFNLWIFPQWWHHTVGFEVFRNTDLLMQYGDHGFFSVGLHFVWLKTYCLRSENIRWWHKRHQPR